MSKLQSTHKLVGQDALIKRAGKSRYQRGVAAYDPSNVQHYQSNEDTVRAEVEGYQVELNYRGGIVDGHCTCEESDGFDFCHHCVQLVLHSNRLSQQLLSLSKGPEKSRILAYLLGLEQQDLAKQMLELLERDSEQFERYVLRASLASDDIDFVKLKSKVTELTRVEDKRNLFSQRQVKAYFAKLEQLFAEFVEAEFELNPIEGLKLVEYALSRMNSVLQQVEDKWNFRQASAEYLQDLYCRLFALHEGRPLTLIKRFEKTIYNDHSALLGNKLAIYLQSIPELETLFNERSTFLWAQSRTPEPVAKQSEGIKSKKTLRDLPQLEATWQWQKLASHLDTVARPDWLGEQHYLWRQSLREVLATTPIAWLSWLDEVEQERGDEEAYERVLVALQRFSNNENLARRAVQLAFKTSSEQAISTLVEQYPTVFVDWLAAHPSEENLLHARSRYETLYHAISKIDPHHDAEERQYRTLTQLVALAIQDQDATLVQRLALDQRLMMEQRVALLKELDTRQSADAARIVREQLIPQLLHKKQNRSDDLAAEQLVLLRRDYQQLGLSQADFDGWLVPIEHSMDERANFKRLVDKYSKQFQSHSKHGWSLH